MKARDFLRKALTHFRSFLAFGPGKRRVFDEVFCAATVLPTRDHGRKMLLDRVPLSLTVSGAVLPNTVHPVARSWSYSQASLSRGSIP